MILKYKLKAEPQEFYLPERALYTEEYTANYLMTELALLLKMGQIVLYKSRESMKL